MASLIGLGRHHAPDTRDRKYALHPPTAPASRTSRYWLSLGEAFDQGATSMCVAYSGVRWLVTRPVVNAPIPFADLYADARANDEWEGEDYDGTSVRGLFKALKTRGLVSEYRWAFDAETVVNHLLTTGPVVLGITWKMDMFSPDRWGYISFTGEPAGGHAIAAIGVNRKKVHPLTKEVGAIRLINSWGTGWAEKGRCWVSLSDLQHMLDDSGEACTAMEIKLAPGAK
jgi:hypothetical protein